MIEVHVAGEDGDGGDMMMIFINEDEKEKKKGKKENTRSDEKRERRYDGHVMFLFSLIVICFKLEKKIRVIFFVFLPDQQKYDKESTVFVKGSRKLFGLDQSRSHMNFRK